jgi:signal transduction histidine kinase
LSFDAPANVRIQYQLENFEDGWQDAGEKRMASYQHLDPGEYTFHVRACNSDGVWNEEGASFGFSVVPFFWQRLWFRVTGLVVFTGVVVVLARYVSFRRLRTRLRVLEQQTALQKERARIARDLHDDLGARLTEIVMLSDLTLHENGNGEPKQRVGQISAAARQGIKSLDETVWAVNPRNDSLSHLVDYIGQFAVEFLRSANIRCRVDLLENAPDHPVSAEVRHNLLLVVKEALNNIVRHSGATEARLRVQLMKERACMIIEDNGCPLRRMDTRRRMGC